MKKAMAVMLVAVVLFFGAVFGWKAFVGAQIAKSMQAMVLPPVTVSTAPVTTATWDPAIVAVGTLRAAQGVDVTAQTAGIITALRFDSGDKVAAGDVLLEQYSADERARLEGLVAQRKLAELNDERAADLARQNLISEFDRDARATELKTAQAGEKDLRLQIEQKIIRAPFAGRLGIRQVDVGQYIEPGDAIARLESDEQMLVDFKVPQREFANLREGQPVFLAVDAWPGERFGGKVAAIAPQVDIETRNLSVRAVVDNGDGKLVAGMFARVDVQLPRAEKVLTVPQSALTYSPYGDSVFVVDESVNEAGDTVLTVSNTFVVTGATRGDQVAITSGLEPGMTVVTAGQQKLRGGAQVMVDNSVSVSNDPAPEVTNN